MIKAEVRTGYEDSDRWPLIGRFLWIDDVTGQVDDDFHGWCWRVEGMSLVERAAGYEEWAEFWEWRLRQRAAELADDRRKRYLVEQWTDSMAYCCRRSAACARGEDPGEWVPQWERRPELYAEGAAMVAEIVTEVDAGCRPIERVVMAG